jgi:hypothetical protein
VSWLTKPSVHTIVTIGTTGCPLWNILLSFQHSLWVLFPRSQLWCFLISFSITFNILSTLHSNYFLITFQTYFSFIQLSLPFTFDLKMQWYLLFTVLWSCSHWLAIWYIYIYYSPTCASLKWSPALRLPHQTPVSISPPSHTCYMLHPPVTSWFDHPVANSTFNMLCFIRKSVFRVRS